MDDLPLNRPAQTALEAYGAHTSTPPTDAQCDAVWRAAVSDFQPAPRQVFRKLAWVGALSMAVGVLAWRAVLPAVEEVQSSPSAQWHREADAVTLDRGAVRVAPRGDLRLSVITPQVQAWVQRAAAWFDVTPRGTILSVESGEVEWRSGARKGRVGAGERVTIAPVDSTLVLPPRGEPMQGCAGAGEQRCLEEAAAGGGLTAETALYELALVAHERGELPEAVRRFRAYGARFPKGAFAPEASIGLMLDLRADDKPREAALEAANFPVRFGGDPRVAAVRRWSAQIP